MNEFTSNRFKELESKVTAFQKSNSEILTRVHLEPMLVSTIVTFWCDDFSSPFVIPYDFDFSRIENEFFLPALRALKGE